jgi:hypothetical protein
VRGPRKTRGLWQVIADGHAIHHLGRTCFPQHEAEVLAADLRTRGYDAVTQKWEPASFHPAR